MAIGRVYRFGEIGGAAEQIYDFGESPHVKSLHDVAIFVNTACSDFVATLCGMREDEIRKRQGRRLEAAREAAGYRSARAAALGNRWPESTYRAHEGGTRTIGQDDAERYARAFRNRGAKVDAKSILFEPGEPISRPAPPLNAQGIARVPLLDWVSAGKLAEPRSQIPVEDVPLLAFADLGRGEFFALKIKGDSMDRVAPEDAIIVVNRADRMPVVGKPYIFAHRGETTFKLWRTDPDRLAPYSWNAANEPIFIKKKRDLEIIGRVKRVVLDL